MNFDESADGHKFVTNISKLSPTSISNWLGLLDGYSDKRIGDRIFSTIVTANHQFLTTKLSIY